MDPNSATLILLLTTCSISNSISQIHCSSIQEELSQPPPPDFNTTIANNCLHNPFLRYCNRSESEIADIFRSTIVTRHLCAESNNPNCNESFSHINLQQRPEIVPLYLSFSSFWKFCPLTILTINLSHNSLNGPFPSQILQCIHIQSLDLSHNNLVGPIPVRDFAPLADLIRLNLSYNRFSGDGFHRTQLFKRFDPSSFINSGLADRKFAIESTIILLGFMVSVVGFVGCSGFLFLHRPDFLPAAFRRRNRFTPAILRASTDGFSGDNLVGTNGRFEVYRGVLRDGREVRVEICRERTSREIRREFVEECETLVGIHHRNLVEVYGWCERRRFVGVVKGWVRSESVERWLRVGGFTWKQRLKVMVGVAEGMCYLEEKWPRVGCDLRSSTVFVDQNGEALIGRLKVGDQTSVSKRVYKFGIFLFELVANKRAHEDFERGETEFIEWMGMHYPGHVRKVIDERMKKMAATCEQVTQVIAIGLSCTSLPPDRWPSVCQISGRLNKVYDSRMARALPAHK